MQKYILLFVLLLSISILAEDIKQYGNEITSTEKVNISQVLENPETFVGKKILVEPGFGKEVCFE